MSLDKSIQGTIFPTPQRGRSVMLAHAIKRMFGLFLVLSITLMTVSASPVHATGSATQQSYPYEEEWTNGNLTTVFDGTKGGKNPFPEVVSEAELDQHFAMKAQGSNNDGETHTYTVFRINYRDGRQVVTDKGFGNPRGVKSIEAFIVFQPQVGDKSWPYKRTSFSAYGGAVTPQRSAEGGLVASPYTGVTATGVLNGDEAHAVVSRPDDAKKGEPIIGMYDIKGRQYMRFVMEYPQDCLRIQAMMHPIKETKNTSGNNVESSLQYLSLIPKASASFHFVEDFSYRGLRPGVVNPENPGQLPPGALAPDAEIPERSAGTAVYSDAAFSEKAISPLHAPVSTKPSFFYLGNIDAGAPYEPRSPLLNPGKVPAEELGGLGGDAKQGLTKESAEFHASVLYTDKDIELTEQSLTATKVPGYVYIDNDIDTKPAGKTYGERGNWIAALAYNAEKQLLDQKHYYLTYRAIPRRVLIHKVDEATGKDLAGAEFELLFKAPNPHDAAHPTLVPVRSGLITDAEGKIQLGDPAAGIDYLRELVKKPAAVQEFYHNIYVDPAHKDDASHGVYLMPGDYVLRETQAPAGYELPGKDLEFTVTADEEETGAVLPLKVSNKETTPTPTPTPEPTPTPTPTPEPTPTPTPTPEPTPSTTPTPEPTPTPTPTTTPTPEPTPTPHPTPTPTPTPDPKLPDTGFAGQMALVLGIVALSAGVLLVLVARRRAGQD